MQTSGFFSPILLLPAPLRQSALYAYIFLPGQDEPMASLQGYKVTRLCNSHITSELAANQHAGHMTHLLMTESGSQLSHNCITAALCSL